MSNLINYDYNIFLRTKTMFPKYFFLSSFSVFIIDVKFVEGNIDLVFSMLRPTGFASLKGESNAYMLSNV